MLIKEYFPFLSTPEIHVTLSLYNVMTRRLFTMYRLEDLYGLILSLLHMTRRTVSLISDL